MAASSCCARLLPWPAAVTSTYRAGTGSPISRPVASPVAPSRSTLSSSVRTCITPASWSVVDRESGRYRRELCWALAGLAASPAPRSDVSAW
jgi:hypothetical protein